MPSKLGVIGGMGPKASSYFYDLVIDHTRAASDQEHLDLVILSHASMPDRTAAIESGDATELVRELTHDAVTLERLGVSTIAIPCNTSHYFYEQVRGAVGIDVIHMPRETVRAAAARAHRSPSGQVRTIGILATDGTVSSGVYHRECEARGIRPVTPSAANQSKVMSLIYDDIKSGRPGRWDLFAAPLDELREAGCDAIVLACTELSVFGSHHDLPELCIDALDVLVRESIVRCGADYV